MYEWVSPARPAQYNVKKGDFLQSQNNWLSKYFHIKATEARAKKSVAFFRSEDALRGVGIGSSSGIVRDKMKLYRSDEDTGY